MENLPTMDFDALKHETEFHTVMDLYGTKLVS